jgi:hypothetical protein
MKKFAGLLALLAGTSGQAQHIVQIDFHLYTDSLKKGVYNYINVDALLSDSTYRPLTEKELSFASNTGVWDGCSLIIDSAYRRDSVEVTAILKENVELKRTVTIYMKKNTQGEKLKTQQELLDEWRKRKG